MQKYLSPSALDTLTHTVVPRVVSHTVAGYALIDIHVPFYDYFKPFLFLTLEAGTHSRLAERAGMLSVSGCKNESVVLHLRVFDLFTLKQMSFFFCVYLT